ncbi:MAG: phosphoribosylamine--glycine ligase [Candidatus Omnitrophota bacterium]
MNILVIGSGGREHSLAWKIKQNPKVKKLYCAPGNGGMAPIAECVDIQAAAIEDLIKFAKAKEVDLTVVGPEAPLVDGIVDAFRRAGLKIFGPSQAAARLEGSKIFAKEFMQRYNIPTANFETFSEIEKAKRFLKAARFPLVVKAEGLAAGKGVVICQNKAEGLEAIDQMMEKKIFAEAGRRVVIEECLAGEEASILAVSDGENACVLESSQDHKRIFDEDKGPNTGGMGAYSPTPVITDEIIDEVIARVIEPTIRGMNEDGNPFKGILYAGLMITAQGPKVLEYNVRFGDPETQAILPRLKTDLVDVMMASCEGNLGEVELKWDKRPCVCVVMSSGGYPGKYATGYEISGLPEAEKVANTVVFHSGTKREGDRVLTAGGRVLGVTSLGADIKKAVQNAYQAVEKIKFEHCFFRRDIGAKALDAMGRKSHAAVHE